MQVFWEITLYRSVFPDVSRYRSAFIFRIKQLWRHYNSSKRYEPSLRALAFWLVEFFVVFRIAVLTAEVRVRSRASQVGFVVDKVAPGQVSHRVLAFSAAGIIPPILHAHLHINTILESCAFLGYYAASSGNSLPTFRDNLSVPSLARRMQFSFISRRKPEITEYHS